MISFTTLLLRLGLAVLLGAVIGLERERGERAAGMRTQALVALGSALFTIVSAFGFTTLLGTPHLQFDPSRIASYIVAGIGFLGAGTIFVSREQGRVKGLTTAASIWVVAAIGLACGAGLLQEATVTVILALIVLGPLHLIEERIFPWHAAATRGGHRVTIEVDPADDQLLARLYAICSQSGVTIVRLTLQMQGAGVSIEVHCHLPESLAPARLAQDLHNLPGIRRLEIHQHPLQE